jgi:hypothetical protein
MFFTTRPFVWHAQNAHFAMDGEVGGTSVYGGEGSSEPPVV